MRLTIFFIILFLSGAYFSTLDIYADGSVTSTQTPTGQAEPVAITAANVGHLRQTFAVQSRSAHITTIAFSPDGKLLAIGSAEGAIELWTAQTGKKVTLLQGHTDVVNDLAFSLDGKFLASTSRDKTVRVWNLADDKEIYVFQDHMSNVTHVAFSPDGKMLLSSGENAAILWQLPSKTKVVLMEGPEDAPAFTARFSPDGSIIVVSARNSVTNVWATSTLKVQGQLGCTAGYDPADIFTSIVFSPNSRLIACGLATGVIQIWDIASLKELHEFQQENDEVKDLTFSPNGKFLATSGDRTVQLWNINSEAALLGSQLDCSVVTNAIFSPDSSLMGYGGLCPEKEAGFLALFETASGKQVRMFNMEGEVYLIAFNPNGTQIVATVGGEVLSWMLR